MSARSSRLRSADQLTRPNSGPVIIITPTEQADCDYVQMLLAGALPAPQTEALPDGRYRHTYHLRPEPKLVLDAQADKPWPTRDAIERLCQFAESELANDYDGQGWEELQTAARTVRAALDKLNERTDQP